MKPSPITRKRHRKTSVAMKTAEDAVKRLSRLRASDPGYPQALDCLHRWLTARVELENAVAKASQPASGKKSSGRGVASHKGGRP